MIDKVISIIVPVYEAEGYLRDSVASLLNQTYSNIEIVLVDDGSKDFSGRICDELAVIDNRITVVHKLNGGQSSARNLGMSIAKGDYICFMDNDDFYYPEMCQTLLLNIEQNGADIAAGSFISRNESGRITHDSHTSQVHIFNNDEGMEAFLSRKEMDVYVWTKMYKKSFLIDNGIFFEEGRSDEDFLFNALAFSYAKSTIYQDIPLYIYIERDNSTCRTFHKTKMYTYLNDTSYRVNKIETMVAGRYKNLLPLAKYQTILYSFRMLGVMAEYKRSECEPFYTDIVYYLHHNRTLVLRGRAYWGVSWAGVILAAFCPLSLYFKLKKIRKYFR